ncbi:hypothetical protein D9619_010780 [Psilocybe cf. subviscida]|uniref:Uncharacterized protein n=1 Tax=Psilocybe cf. subviscida TaxID=2480587 RepID=A0A8H5F0A5_9AGAR|nr:hypothetical protein D9619_010780 [Psilocybe cf. subviscida]
MSIQDITIFRSDLHAIYAFYDARIPCEFDEGPSLLEPTSKLLIEADPIPEESDFLKRLENNGRQFDNAKQQLEDVKYPITDNEKKIETQNHGRHSSKPKSQIRTFSSNSTSRWCPSSHLSGHTPLAAPGLNLLDQQRFQASNSLLPSHTPR